MATVADSFWDTLKSFKTYIGSTTKVSEWILLLNKVASELRKKEKVYKTTVGYEKDPISGDIISTNIASEYALNGADFSNDDSYMVQYGGVILEESDYTLTGNKLIFNEAPSATELGTPIRIFYIGKSNA